LTVFPAETSRELGKESRGLLTVSARNHVAQVHRLRSDEVGRGEEKALLVACPDTVPDGFRAPIANSVCLC